MSKSSRNADQRLSDGPATALKQFKAKVAGLRRRKRFINRREAPEYLRELRDVVRVLRDIEPDTRTGVQSALQLLAADGVILNACDDSDGVIGDFFRYDVKDLFVSYAGVGLAAAGLDIARVYLEAHDPDTALRWLEKTDSGGDFQRRERQDLKMAIYRDLGDTEKQTELAWRIFSGHYSPANLDQLLAIIGKDQRPAVLADTVLRILNQPGFDASQAIFLIEVDQADAAERYLFRHGDAVDGYDYASLLWIAKRMEKQDRPLAATILYRALLDSILDRAKSTSYAQGVRYLKKMDQLADKIQDWRDFKNHAEYLAGLRSQHSRKYAFWLKYAENR